MTRGCLLGRHWHGGITHQDRKEESTSKRERKSFIISFTDESGCLALRIGHADQEKVKANEYVNVSSLQMIAQCSVIWTSPKSATGICAFDIGYMNGYD